MGMGLPEMAFVCESSEGVIVTKLDHLGPRVLALRAPA